MNDHLYQLVVVVFQQAKSIGLLEDVARIIHIALMKNSQITGNQASIAAFL